LNRRDIIDIVYNGLGQPAQFSIPNGSRYFSPALAKTAVAYNPEKANQLLDKLGLDVRDSVGLRMLPNGRAFAFDINAAQEANLVVANLACKYWQHVGINAQLKVRNGPYINQMLAIGICDSVVHREGGNYFGPVLAGAYAPTHPAECPQYPKWSEWLRSGGRSGWAPPDHIKELDFLWQRVARAPNDEAKYAAWQALMDRTARDLPLIGTLTPPGKIIYVRNGFMNVPKFSLAGWIAHEPANACPEVFYDQNPKD